ncbi:MAG: ATP-binding cassette domain-containing protein [Deltaproteobacteria bacterium]|nr:ATP-binding cassette domain-containing protein [Deltaproteobacteria bacterium]
MIRVNELGKRYGKFKALQGITFEVPRGQVLGFLGPNGAGKTTTMKILTCFLAPSAGSAFVGGYSIAEQSLQVRRLLGYLPEDTPIYPDMTVLEYLEYVGDIRGVESGLRRRRIGDLAEICGLMKVLSRPVGHLSKGLRQRAGLAQALLHDPPILVLDEPTSGLDPNQIVEIRQLIRHIGEEKTVILSTHILPEVQATCGRVIIINEGRLVADGTPDELASQQHDNSYHVVFDASGFTASGQSDEAIQEQLERVPGVQSVASTSPNEGEFSFTIKGESTLDLRKEIFCCARDNEWILLELQRRQLSLEDVFRRLTR